MMIRRPILLTFIAALLIATSLGAAVVTSPDSSSVGEAVETRVYEIFGMDCPGCHGGIEKLVQKTDGIQKAKANYIEQRLVVTLKPGETVDDEVIYDAIRRANFTPGKRIR